MTHEPHLSWPDHCQRRWKPRPTWNELRTRTHCVNCIRRGVYLDVAVVWGGGGGMDGYLPSNTAQRRVFTSLPRLQVRWSSISSCLLTCTLHFRPGFTLELDILTGLPMFLSTQAKVSTSNGMERGLKHLTQAFRVLELVRPSTHNLLEAHNVHAQSCYKKHDRAKDTVWVAVLIAQSNIVVLHKILANLKDIMIANARWLKLSDTLWSIVSSYSVILVLTICPQAL